MFNDALLYEISKGDSGQSFNFAIPRESYRQVVSNNFLCEICKFNG